MVRKTAEQRAEKKNGKKKDEATATMSVVDHLRELRDRLIWSILAIAIGAIICFIFFGPIIHLMVQPYRDATGKGLIFTQPLEAFMTRIKVAAYQRRQWLRSNRKAPKPRKSR